MFGSGQAAYRYVLHIIKYFLSYLLTVPPVLIHQWTLHTGLDYCAWENVICHRENPRMTLSLVSQLELFLRPQRLVSVLPPSFQKVPQYKLSHRNASWTKRKLSLRIRAILSTVEQPFPLPGWRKFSIEIRLECLSKPRYANAQLCVCSICRKVGGYGGSVHLRGYHDTLKIEGKENIRCVPPEPTSCECCWKNRIASTKLSWIAIQIKNQSLIQRETFALNAHPCSGYTSRNGVLMFSFP